MTQVEERGLTLKIAFLRYCWFEIEEGLLFRIAFVVCHKTDGKSSYGSSKSG